MSSRAIWKWLGKIVLVLVCIAVGFLLGGLFASPDVSEAQHQHAEDASEEDTTWTCSMHPQIRLPNPGLCPICNMELIPLTAAGSTEGAPASELVVSEAAAALMDVQTVPAERRFVTTKVRLVGKVDYDETRLAYITSWIPGRLDRLFVDYTGVPVREGDHLVSLYSPRLLTAQQELVQALETIEQTKESNLPVMRETAQATLEAAREKLRLWGLTQEQIVEIEESRKVSDHMTVYAPTGGIVIHKNAVQGMYVEEGTRIYTIADLSQVWVKLDAYESDLEWLRYGQKVTFTTVAYPGETFTGTIAFIDPILNSRTRTAKVRVNVRNPQGKLKPEMFVKATVEARLAAGGEVTEQAIAGKWICPMHPSVVKPDADECDICGMPLVTAQSLGYAGEDPNAIEPPLVVPASAPLITGTRAIVYVKKMGGDKPTFQGREIVLGPRAGDYYLVREGLREGELVVVNGNFKIDSALQIQARPSMMSPDEMREPAHDHAGHMVEEKAPSAVMMDVSLDSDNRRQLGSVYDGYFRMQKALADDDVGGAAAAADQMLQAVNAVDASALPEEAAALWNSKANRLRSLLSRMDAQDAIQQMREGFYTISQHMIAMAKSLGPFASDTVYLMYCPMAFDDSGAQWLQDNDQLLNPYFGETMLKCGSVEQAISRADADAEKE